MSKAEPRRGRPRARRRARDPHHGRRRRANMAYQCAENLKLDRATVAGISRVRAQRSMAASSSTPPPSTSTPSRTPAS